MPDPITKSDVFKFVTLRAPAAIERKKNKLHFIRDRRKPEETPVGQFIARFTQQENGRLLEQLREWTSVRGYTPDFADKDNRLSVFYAYAAGIRDDFSYDALKQKAEEAAAMPLADFIRSGETSEWRNQLWDRYYAFFILNRLEPHNLENLTAHLRTLHLLEVLSSGESIGDAAQLAPIVRATPVIPKMFVDLSKPVNDHKENGPEESKHAPRYRALWNEFLQTNETLNEIRNLSFDNLQLAEDHLVTANDQPSSKSSLAVLKKSIVTGKTAFHNLSCNSRNLLEKLNIREDTLQLPVADMRLTEKMTVLYDQLLNTRDQELIRYMPNEALAIPGVYSIVAALEALPQTITLLPFFPATSARSLIKPLGVGDLRVVKQKLKKYVAGEVAHIENVLQGESKERRHRVLDRTEDILTVSEENNEETTKDLQTTERFELKKESERTVEEQMSIQAGLTVSGSYGMVTFGAHADFAYNTSTTDSNKTASNFAREVIDKSVSKIQKRTKRERTTKTLHEVEEINTHGLNNVEGDGHITGIYRWVDKHYDAQVYNYGKRMMFEMIIPEPAAFFEFAQQNKPKKNIVAPVPLPAGLTHKSITEWNYQTYIRDYNVQGVTPPPAASKMISMSLDQSGMQNGHTFSKTSKELVVPEGYVAANLGFSLSATYENNPQAKLSIGNDHGWATLTDTDARRRWDSVHPASFPLSYDGVIPVSLHGYDIHSFFLNVSVVCNRLPAKYELWQIQTFEKIMTAYKTAQAEYEQKVNAQETQQGIAITGQNPRINREIEKTELKKHCLKMFMDTTLYGSFNAMRAGSPPEFDIFDAFGEGRHIQFFEQCFEWENLTYLYYPYFWGRRSEWLRRSTTFDNDPLFTQFLQSGAARVVVPVHPSYNDAILHYLETGAIWSGGDAPRIDDPLFISIHEELRNQTDDLGNAVAEGDPWEVVLPTTLVYLQQEPDLPEFS